MHQDSESTSQNVLDPIMNRHRPASEKTQDISHLLASIFKDLYTAEVIGKDKVANLTKSRRGGNSYQDTYVEELQQARLEYNQRISEADMLEKHILQARLQATAKEELVHNKIVEEVGEVYHQLGLPPVKSTFKWCVDNTLLKSNNLICPEDYITEQTPPIKVTRGKSPPGFANPTICFSKHISSLPQDDGYTVIPPPDRMAQDMLEHSEGTLTLPSTPECSTLSQSKRNEKRGQGRRPVWSGELSRSLQAEESAALLRLKERNNFLRNPRFLPPHAQRGGKSLILPAKRVERVVNGRRVVVEERVLQVRQNIVLFVWGTEVSPEEPVPVFLANPPIVLFTDYRLGHVYETTVELRNLTATSRHVRVIPPNTPHFSIGLGKFPGEGGTVAPGMSCQYTVRFVPDSLADFEDFILVETQAPYPLIVPIEAQRTPPVLTLPRVLDCGYCLVGGVKIVEFLCQNEGLSAGTFCIMPKRLWPASNLRSVVTGSFAEQPPFGISPSLFDLLPGQATVVEVAFFPRTPESCSQAFTIVCDNCQVKDIFIQGTGQLITLELVSVTEGEDRPALGEICDLTAEHFIRFGPANPHSVLQKTLVIRNNAHLELPFHWQVVQPNLRPLLPAEPPEPAEMEHRLTADAAFDISPQTGSLGPHQDHEFLLSYCPQELREYHSVCHLVLRDIPSPPKEPTEKGESQHLEMATKVNDVIVMEIEVKGSTEPHRVLLEPYAIRFPGETFIRTAIRKRFKMWNNSRSPIQFQWDRLSDCHILEVEPPMGEIEMCECCDMELVLTGGKPGPFVTSLQCHIQHHSQPVALSVEASFMGPRLSINVPSLDFGLMKLGDQARSTVHISNNSQLEASWVIDERPDSHEITETQIVIQPHRGVLPPLASCCVDVLFRPVACQHFETILELAVENGTGCHLAVQANVQSPSVCLLSCELVFSELYVGVPVKGTVTLFNQTLLPAHFSWGKLQGKQSSLCSACFFPSDGVLGPNDKMEVVVEFTAHTDMELTEVAGICEVKGMQDPLVLGFFSKAKGLHVSYSLPVTERPAAGSPDPSDLVLDFGGDILLMRAATKQLMITNHTAIPAPFHLEAEYFTGRPPTPPQEGSADSRPRASFLRRQIQHVQAKKVEGKTYQDFVNSLLAHGKGAAFFIQPASGTLGPFETRTVDITAFTNMWGDYTDHLICKVGDLEPAAVPIKMSVRGCPVYFQMMGPQLETQTQGPIIRFGTHVSGGDTVSRSLRLNNTSPYNIRMDWETYNQEMGDQKLVDLVVCYGDAFPLKDADGNEVLGGRRGSSESITPRWDWRDTPCSSGTSSSLSSEDCAEEEEEQEEEEEEEPLPVQKNLISVHLRAHEGNVSDYPYCITPQQIMVPAGGSTTIHVSFTPLTLSGPTNDPVCAGFALGFMRLDCKVASCVPGKVERVQGFELVPLRLDLQASVKQALLLVQMEEEEEALEFYAIASDLIQHKGRGPSKEVAKESMLTRNLQLKNTTEMRLNFRLSTHPPFSVLLPQSRAGTGSTDRHAEERQSLILRPQHNLQVKVGFHSSLSLLAYLGQPEEQLPSGVQLIHTDSGERKLRFQQNLAIEYSNSSVQLVPLCAHLSLPTLSLSETSLDFGTCYVGQTRVKEVFLCSRGGSCSYWTAVVDAHEQAGQFTVTPVSGVLEHSVTHYRQPLQISFTASEQGKARASITVQGILGESPILLQVQGKGSFDERFVSLLVDA